MRKLVESTFMTLDGVITRPQDWSGPYWDEEHAKNASDLLFASDTLLLGRATYESFAGAWAARSGDPFTDRINAMPKYVASRTLQEATWNSTVIKGDIAAGVAKLKQQDGLNILKYGTGELDKQLVETNLIDEFHFWIFPVAGAKGDHAFDQLELTHLNLDRSTTLKSGIVILVYTPK